MSDNLLKYIQDQDYHMVDLMLQNGADPDQLCEFTGNHPLTIAIYDPIMVQLLLSYGSSPDIEHYRNINSPEDGYTSPRREAKILGLRETLSLIHHGSEEY